MTVTETMTDITCAGCGAPIAIVRDKEDDWTTTECGGQGEGVCDAVINGDRAAEDSHCLALD